jgi:hypothetical protein
VGDFYDVERGEEQQQQQQQQQQQPFHPRATPCLPDKEILSARASSPTLWGEFIV